MQDQQEQLGFELGVEETAPGQPNLSEIREDLSSILQEARAGTQWSASELRYKKIVFLRLAELLPVDECRQLSFEFTVEVERIEQLLAA